MNENFDRIFLSDDALGGYDVVVVGESGQPDRRRRCSAGREPPPAATPADIDAATNGDRDRQRRSRACSRTAASSKFDAAQREGARCDSVPDPGHVSTEFIAEQRADVPVARDGSRHGRRRAGGARGEPGLRVIDAFASSAAASAAAASCRRASRRRIGRSSRCRSRSATRRRASRARCRSSA